MTVENVNFPHFHPHLLLITRLATQEPHCFG